jgi:hypothetical protein
MAWGPQVGGSYFDSTNLVAYWGLSDLTDASGNGYTLTNSATPVTFGAGGAFGNCGTFVKANSTNLQYANNGGIDGGAITMSCWAKVSANPANNTILTFMNQNSATSKTTYTVFYRNNAGALYISWYRSRIGTEDKTFDYTVTLSPGVWYNVVLTYNATNLVGFLNGIQTGTIAASGNGASSRGSNINIGGQYATWDFYEGQIDEALVFSRAWTAAEVAQYYARNCGKFGKVPGATP